MNAFLAAFWAETLKARRSRISLMTAAAIMLLPFAGGLFMIILKNPEQARAIGLVSTKAQLSGGTAEWPFLWAMYTQGIAIAGAILFAFVTSWVFGREFSDHTAKELLATPTPRWVIVVAKLALMALWSLGLTLLVFAVGVAVGAAIGLPGWSTELGWLSFRTMLVTALLTIMLMPLVALVASAGKGYLAPLGWTFLALAIGQIVGILGWGDWFPWAVPMLVSGMVRSGADQIGLHSYLVVCGAFLVGVAATLAWWRSADQTR